MMFPSLFTTSAVLASTLLASAVTAFDASSNGNLAVYWGQGSDQLRLRHFCEDSSIDIIPIGFVNIFPDQGAGGYPGDNFGNQCSDAYYTAPNGTKSQLLSNCPTIAADIPYCQSLGKKILLSLGGAYPGNYYIKNHGSARKFADFLWGAFGPQRPTWGGPRPFGTAVVDGFDFDIESVISPPPTSDYQYANYANVITRLRSLFALDATKTYYISGAPQCVVPDAHLADAIRRSYFDFIFVQFYNTPSCSARAYFDHSYGGSGSMISFDQWANFVRSSSRNPRAKIYIGLPASTSAANDPKMYLSPDEVKQLVTAYQCSNPDVFGGVMLWEATYSENNKIGGKSYADNIKDVIRSCSCSAQTTSSSSSSTASSTSSISVSTTTSISTGMTSTSLSSTIASSTSLSSTSASSTSASSTSTSATSTTLQTTSVSSSSISASSASSSSSVSSTYIGSGTNIGPSTNTATSPTPSSSNIPSGSTTSSSRTVSSSSSTFTSSTTLYNVASPESITTSTTSRMIGASSKSGSSMVGMESSTSVSSSTNPAASGSSSAQSSGPTAGPLSTTTMSSSYLTSSSGSTSAGFMTTSSVRSSSSEATFPTNIVTTVITTVYTDICPTGLTAVTTTWSTTINPALTTTNSIPEGWTTSVAICTMCGPTPTTVTLTVPCTTSRSISQKSSASSSANTASTSASSNLASAGPLTGSPTSMNSGPTGSPSSASSAVGSSGIPQPDSNGPSSGLGVSDSVLSSSVGPNAAQALPAQGSQPAPSSSVAVSQVAQNTATPVSTGAVANSGIFVTLTSQLTVYSTSASTASVVCANESNCPPPPLAGKEMSLVSTSTGSAQVVTMTIVPVPKNHAQSAGPSSASYGSGTAISSASPLSGTSASATVPTFPAAPVFTGAGVKKSASGFGLFAMAVALFIMA